MDKFNVKRGVIITKNLMERKKINRKEVMLVPAWIVGRFVRKVFIRLGHYTR